LESIRVNFNIEKLEDKIHSTSKKYKVPGFAGTFAFITTMTTPFCSDCNRLRLTADGKMKNCLFSKGEADLLTPFRNGEDIIPIIKKCVGLKEASLGGQTDPEKIENRSMILIGG
jgi:cyclic pyranopterin phosphate synthase